MNKKHSILFAIAIVVAFVLSSCGKYPGFKKTDDGVYYKFHHQSGDTIMPRDQSILTLSMKYRTKIDGKDSVLFNSSQNPSPFLMGYQKTDVKGDIYSALATMHKGDSATFILNAGTFFTKTVGGQVPQGIDSTGVIYFDIKMLDIQTKEQFDAEMRKKSEVAKAAEAGLISAYIAKNNITVKPDTTGIYKIIEKEGTGIKLQNGMMGLIHLTLSLADGKEIFSSIKQQQAPIPFEYGKPFDTKGFDIITKDMKVGSKIKALVPSAMGFGEQGRKDMMNNELIPQYASLVYEIELVDAKSKAVFEKEMAEKKSKAEAAQAVANTQASAEEAAKISQYIKSNNITVKPTPSGLYFVETKKGTGAKAENGKKVQVNYKGYLFDGKVFDESKGKPFEFVLGQGSVIRGWDEAIAMMQEGSKAKLVLPSAIAYGEMGAGADIKPFTPLVFDVELLKVLK